MNLFQTQSGLQFVLNALGAVIFITEHQPPPKLGGGANLTKPANDAHLLKRFYMIHTYMYINTASRRPTFPAALLPPGGASPVEDGAHLAGETDGVAFTRDGDDTPPLDGFHEP